MHAESSLDAERFNELVEILPEEFQQRELFISRLVQIYGTTVATNIVAEQKLAATDRQYSYWINPLRPSEFLPIGLKVEGVHAMWAVGDKSLISHSDAAAAGEVYIQNASSRFAVEVLGPQPGEEILDLAAAPGGKTIAIAAAMQNTGRLAAVEPVKNRFHRLRANLERCGVTISALYQRDGRGVGRAVPQRFDRVLIDAPCSSESHMRWEQPETYKHWSKQKVKECQRKQKSLLKSAYNALKPGGTLVYSTCSYAPEENELVVEHLLRRSDALVEDVHASLEHTLPGLTSWNNKSLNPKLVNTLRILPAGPWDGFYIAKIRKPS